MRSSTLCKAKQTGCWLLALGTSVFPKMSNYSHEPAAVSEKKKGLSHPLFFIHQSFLFSPTRVPSMCCTFETTWPKSPLLNHYVRPFAVFPLLSQHHILSPPLWGVLFTYLVANTPNGLHSPLCAFAISFSLSHCWNSLIWMQNCSFLSLSLAAGRLLDQGLLLFHL